MINPNDKCTGCGACYNVCPSNAIKMVKKLGYFYPEISNKCIHCSSCDKVCMLNKENEKTEILSKYLYRSQQNISESSSGGFCFSIIEYFINNNGVVFSAIFDAREKKVFHKQITKENLSSIRGSKYVKSNHFQIFKTIKQNIENNKKVLFIGMPCEVNGLLNYLQSKPQNLTTVALLCGGAVSDEYFTKYLDELEKHYKLSILNINFRDKKFGSNILLTSVKFTNNKIKILPHKLDYYIPLEGSKYVRPSCHFCSLTPDKICSDFVVGDSFGSQERKNGLNIIFVKSKNGENIINKMDNDSTCDETIVASSRAINNQKQHKMNNINYEDFYLLAKESLKKAVHKNIFKNYTLKQKIYVCLPNRIKAIK